MEAIQIIDLIQNTKGTLSKESILKKHKDNTHLKSLLFLAYNPFYSYGVKSLDLVPQDYPIDSYRIDEFIELCITLNNKNVSGVDIMVLKMFLEKQDTISRNIYLSIVTKSLSIGLAAKSINKIIENLIPSFDCMLADTIKDPSSLSYPMIAQEKLDGVRAIMIKKDGKVTFHTRQGNKIPLLLLSKALQEFPNDNFVLDGELLLTNTERKNTSGKINSLLKSGYNKEIDELVEYYMFDFMTLEEWESKTSLLPAFDRAAEVMGITSLLGAPFYFPKQEIITNESDSKKFYQEIRKSGGEGVILKTNSPYEWKRSKNWIKLKAILSCTLKIVDITTGNGKNKGKVGAVVCESSDGLIKVNVNPKTDEDRDWFTNNSRMIRGLLAEVLFNELIQDKTGEYSLFLPRFSITWQRFDKNSPDSLADVKREALSELSIK